MRAWPPIQLLIALAILGGSAIALYSIMGGRNSPAHLSIQKADTNNEETEESSHVQVVLQSTSDVDLATFRWGETPFSFLPVPNHFWRTSASVNTPSGPLHISGTAEKLPAAIRIEVDRENQPTDESIYWIDHSPFSITIHFESPEAAK